MKVKYFYLCAALFALNSCTNEIIEDGFVDKSNTISFNSSTPKSRAYTSGDVANTTKLQEGNFGVVGYSNNALYLGTTSKAAEQTYADGNWKYANADEIRYWPNNNMDFYAYFPFAATGDEFSDVNNSDNVMTITNNTGNQDVLFASALNQARQDRVDLQFHHAFSKIGGINIQIQNKDVTVEVKKVELINTFTKGQVLVDKEGKASYGNPTEHRAKDISPVTITMANTYNVSETTYKTLVDNNDNAYIFATNGTETNFVTNYENSESLALENGYRPFYVKAKVNEVAYYVGLVKLNEDGKYELWGEGEVGKLNDKGLEIDTNGVSITTSTKQIEGVLVADTEANGGVKLVALSAKDNVTGVETPEADGKAVIYGTKGAVVVAGADGKVTIFDAMGRKVKTVDAKGVTTIQMPAGYYIVHTAETAKSVIVM